MKSTQLMLALDSSQTNRAMFRIFQCWGVLIETKALLWKPQFLRFFARGGNFFCTRGKMLNLSRHMDEVVLLSPIEVATLSAPYEWARVLLIKTNGKKGDLLHF